MACSDRLPLGVTAVMLPELDLDQQIDLCRSLGVTHYVYRPRHIPDGRRHEPYSNWGNHRFDLTPERLAAEGADLARQLRDAGLVPWCTVPRLTADVEDEELELHLAGAAAGGCQRVRIMPTPYPGERVFDFGEYLDQARKDLAGVVERARAHQLKAVIEMHVGTAACSPGLTRLLVQDFDPAHVGVILDLPNFAREGAIRPNLAISVLSDWVDHCHVGGSRRVQGDYDEHGFRKAGQLMCPLTESDMHTPTWVELVASLGREVPLIIEDYTPGVSGAMRLEATARALHRLVGLPEPAGA
ncbi:MAG: TIM barrel protein [Phycisphaeraceae bacterium]